MCWYFETEPPWTDTALNCCMSRNSYICVSFIGRCLNRLRRGLGHELEKTNALGIRGSYNFNEMDSVMENFWPLSNQKCVRNQYERCITSHRYKRNLAQNNNWRMTTYGLSFSDSTLYRCLFFLIHSFILIISCLANFTVEIYILYEFFSDMSVCFTATEHSMYLFIHWEIFIRLNNSLSCIYLFYFHCYWYYYCFCCRWCVAVFIVY